MRSKWIMVVLLSAGTGCAQSVSELGAPDGGESGGFGGFGAFGGFGSTAGAAAGGAAGGGFGGAGAAAGTGPECSPTPGSECVVSPLCGCAASQNCVVSDPAQGTAVCVQSGMVPENHLCSGTGACAPGLACVESTCSRTCMSATECPPGQACVDAVYQGKPVPGLKTCTSGCALDDPNACGPGAGCFLLQDGVTDCRAAGSSTTTCTGLQDCAPGYQCLSEGTCARWCRAGGPPCPTGTCQTGTGSVIIGGAVYGICL